MVGPGNRVIYVGKSIRLRSRLLSYFRAPRGEKAAEIIGHTHRIEWEYVPSEFAALLVEMRAIRQWRPVYNVQHKRDRAYCFVKVTREAAPRLLTVAPTRDDGAFYYGPFSGPRRVREMVRELADLLELRTCPARTPLHFADQMELFGREDTPLCLRADLQRCRAPCARRCTQSEYLDQVSLARRFLEGDTAVPLSILQARMASAVDRLQFEYAAVLRDRIARLDDARAELQARQRSIRALSFVYPVAGFAGNDRVYVLHAGRIEAEYQAPTSDEQARRIAREARRHFARSGTVMTSLTPDRAAETLLVARWFRLHPAELERAWTLPRPARARPAVPQKAPPGAAAQA